MDREEKKMYALKLVRESISVGEEERKYWEAIYEIMTPDQANRLISILENEKLGIARIEEKYSGIDDTLSNL